MVRDGGHVGRLPYLQLGSHTCYGRRKVEHRLGLRGAEVRPRLEQMGLLKSLRGGAEPRTRTRKRRELLSLLLQRLPDRHRLRLPRVTAHVPRLGFRAWTGLVSKPKTKSLVSLLSMS